MRATRAACAVTMIIVALIGGSAPVASAHGSLVDGSPGPGDALAPGGELVALEFDELAEDGRALIAILDADDDPIAVGPARTTADATAVCATTDGLEEGVYRLEYSVTSNDGDLIRGQYEFEVIVGGEATDNDRTASCADLTLDPPGEAQTLDEMGTGSIPAVLPYLLVGLLVIALGLVVRRIRADRSGDGENDGEGAPDPEL